MSEAASQLVVDRKTWTAFFEELGRESERAAAILCAAWMDHLLRLRLEQTYSHGSIKARRALFEANGPFATFSSKINAAFCAGWLDADVYHDLQTIRKIRNEFAHQAQGLSMESSRIKQFIGTFQVPHREFYDWGKLQCAATADGTGIVFYTDSAPNDDIGEALEVSAITFRMAASWIVAYLVANLGVAIAFPDTVQGTDGTA